MDLVEVVTNLAVMGHAPNAGGGGGGSSAAGSTSSNNAGGDGGAGDKNSMDSY